MLKVSDFFILVAVLVSLALSAGLWFNGYKEQGIFTALWVPTILTLGIYFKVTALLARRN
ncbi:hypothetical protein ACJJIW_06040 [Microbulbifer sp. JMSA004]|uniref:hypothetical protein n=1 Tax=unclassified Microbulbifer TaxID=2619833 RepID=UPI0024AE61BA|nr:hypothetical protein [Microbulbifer sp. VAAF005]WHI44792.1 hypothetical protein P0078_13670 [Microbulbifer sp. VAAF005]